MNEPCLLCTDPKISFFNILKHFCSDMEDIKKNICEIHKQPLSEMAMEFMNK